ncbi:hypothetical protein EON65_04025 [archaeon]|nr:MAG: hypothetical protein EON65_04025 [archaeon]
MADEDKDAKIPATGGESNGEEKNDVVVKIGLIGDAQVMCKIISFYCKGIKSLERFVYIGR